MPDAEGVLRSSKMDEEVQSVEAELKSLRDERFNADEASLKVKDAKIQDLAAEQHASAEGACSSVDDESSLRMEDEVELELRKMRKQREDASPNPIVRRGQTTKQFMDDSKKAARGGLGV